MADLAYETIELSPDAFPPVAIYGIERSCHNPSCLDISRWPIRPEDDSFLMLALARATGGCPYCLATVQSKRVSYSPLWTPAPMGIAAGYNDRLNEWRQRDEARRAREDAISSAPNITRLPRRDVA